MRLLDNATIGVLLVEPEQPPRAEWLPNETGGILALLGGSVSILELHDEAVAYLFNENARFNGKRLNRELLGDGGKVLTLVAGSFLIVGLGIENRLVTLSPEQLEKYTKLYAEPQVFIRLDNKIVPWRAQREGA